MVEVWEHVARAVLFRAAQGANREQPSAYSGTKNSSEDYHSVRQDGNSAMSMSCRNERSFLSHEEYETVRATHHPEVYEHDVEGLRTLQVHLRQLRDKEQTLARQRQREARGKAAPRGGSFPGTADQPKRRKQIFAAALKRVSKEWTRLRKAAAHVEAARRALALRRSAQFTGYPASRIAHEGMRVVPSRRRRTISRNAIGRISQRTKVAQAVRDARRG